MAKQILIVDDSRTMRVRWYHGSESGFQLMWVDIVEVEFESFSIMWLCSIPQLA